MTSDPSGRADAPPGLYPPRTATGTIWSWLLAGLPLVMAAMDLVAAVTVGLSWDPQPSDAVTAVTVLVLSLWLAHKDAVELESRGLPAASIWWNLLTHGVYLLVRAIRAKDGDAQRWWVLGVAVLGWVAYVVIGTSLLTDAIGAA